MAGVDRDGRNHDAIHDARVSVSPDRVAADAGQHHARIHARGGPNVQPIPLTPDAGIGQGVFSVDRELGSGYVQQ